MFEPSNAIVTGPLLGRVAQLLASPNKELGFETKIAEREYHTEADIRIGVECNQET